MKRKLSWLCLLTLLVMALLLTGFSGAKYTSSHDVTTDLSLKVFANAYTLTLDGNGGVFEDDSEQALITVAYQGTYGELPVPQRKGYTFDGWFTEKTGGTQIEAETTVEITQNSTVYAHWSANSYTIAYDGNGGTGSMGNTPAVYDQSVKLRANSFEKTGYKFAGWNTKADGSGYRFDDEASVKNLAVSGTATLYAQWEQMRTYRLVYDANGGTNAPAEQMVYADTETMSHTFDISADIPTYVSASGVPFDFLGWSEDPARTAVQRYSADGKTSENAELTLDTSITLEYEAEITTKTLYAVWGVTYRLSYDAGSGSGVPETVEQYGRLTGHTFTVDFTTVPVWAEHEFKYWTTNMHYVTGEESDESVMYPNPSTIFVSPDHSNEILYARYYNRGALTVKYDPNPPYLGTVSNMPENAAITAEVDKVTVPYTISYAVKPTVKNPSESKSYDLLGWSTSPDATEVEYTAGQQVQLSRYNDQATVLYAVWDVMPIITCMDLGDDPTITVNSTSYSDATTAEGYYWNSKCVAWVSRSAAERDPTSVKGVIYHSRVNGKSNRIIIGFSDTKGGTECNAVTLVDKSNGNVSEAAYGKTFKLTKKLWDSKIYDPGMKAYFLPVYAVIDEIVYINVKLDYMNPLYPGRSLTIISDTSGRYLASAFKSGSVSAKFTSKSGQYYQSSGVHLTPSNLRDGSEYSVVGWAWNPDATVPDGQILTRDSRTPPVYAPQGSNTVVIDAHSPAPISLNINDTAYPYSYTKDANGVERYTYTIYTVYEAVTESNTFKVFLDYGDGVAVSPGGGLADITVSKDSHEFVSVDGNTATTVYYDCDFSRCLPAEHYEIIGWSLNSSNLSIAVRQYAVGHPMNGRDNKEALYAVGTPLTVSTTDFYNSEGDYYYKQLYAVYAKEIHFDGSYDGTIHNLPETVAVYNHFALEDHTAHITISDEVPNRDEVLFLGWATEPDGTVVYQPGDTVSVVSDELTLYAVWQKDYSYKLCYDWNYEGGSSQELSYTNTVSHMQADIIQDIPARTGYTFLGWAEAADAEAPAYSSDGRNDTETIVTITATKPNETTVKTLYAVWEENEAEPGTDEVDETAQEEETPPNGDDPGTGEEGVLPTGDEETAGEEGVLPTGDEEAAGEEGVLPTGDEETAGEEGVLPTGDEEAAGEEGVLPTGDEEAAGEEGVLPTGDEEAAGEEGVLPTGDEEAAGEEGVLPTGDEEAAGEEGVLPTGDEEAAGEKDSTGTERITQKDPDNSGEAAAE